MKSSAGGRDALTVLSRGNLVFFDLMTISSVEFDGYYMLIVRVKFKFGDDEEISSGSSKFEI